MKANELRIGNLLQGEPFQLVNQGIYSDGVFAITGYGISEMELGRLQKADPIPLTEEWLRKFGFDIGYHKTETSTQKFYSKLWGTNGVEIAVEDYHYKGFEYQLAKSKYKFLE